MKILRLGIGRVCPVFKNAQRLAPLVKNGRCRLNRTVPVTNQIHTSCVRHGLEEFFDEDSYDAENVSVGRPWRRDELRIKSNEDLHKLWYVLLKERNQIMTMEAMFYDRMEAIPNPERMDKVEESMENLLEVVKERDDAFELFEFGETSDPKTYTVRNAVGIPYQRTVTEHYIPKHMNKRYKLMHQDHEPWMDKYLNLYEEKLRKQRRYKDKMHAKQKKNLAEEFEIPEEEVEELVGENPDHSEDKLKEYLELTEDLNDVRSKGR